MTLRNAFGDLALEATQAAVLAELATKLDEGGTVSLSPETLAALEQVTVTLANTTVALDAPTLAALEQVTATVNGSVDLDADTVTALSAAINTLLRQTPLPTTSRFADENGVAYSATNPVPVDFGGTVNVENLTVQYESVISTVNSTSTPLAANATFMGQWEDVKNYAAIASSFKTDQPSAPNGALLQFSENGVDPLIVEAGTVPANIGGFSVVAPQARYVRVVYTNGPVAQTYLRAEIRYLFNAPSVTQTAIGGATSDLSVATVTKAHMQGRIMSGPYTGLWGALGTDGTGRLLVAVDGTVELGAATLAALENTTVTVANPTTSVEVSNDVGNPIPVTGTVTVTDGTGPLTVDGTVTVSNPTPQGLTDTQLRATPVPVSGTVTVTDGAGPLTVDGTVAVSNFPASVEVSNDTGNPVPVTGTVTVANPTTTVAVSSIPEVEVKNDTGNPLAVSGTVATTTEADTTASGTITASGQSVTITLPGSTSDVNIQLTGAFAGTVVFESTVDGTTWNSRVYRSAGILNHLDTQTSTFPSEWRGNGASMQAVRVRCTAYTSGTLTVAFRASRGVGPIFLNAPIPIGGISLGNTASTTVAAGASWTGAFERVVNVASVNVVLTSTQDGTLFADLSTDGTTAYRSVAYAVTAGQVRDPIIAPRGEFLRFRFLNAGASTATVSIETVYRAVAAQTPLIGVAQSVPADALGAVSKAIIEGGNSWAASLKTVTTTAARIDSGTQGRRSVMVRARNYQNSADQIFVGASSAVASGTGVELKERESVTIDLAFGAQVWAVGTRATGNPVEVVEMWDA